ncbi:MAG: hypothetical protein M1829_006684 [Trizodia sp. TS-e1964]|nr:MAG: hypothetical protein M1829_006684 [Trizodia sp. TS-e1964]
MPMTTASNHATAGVWKAPRVPKHQASSRKSLCLEAIPKVVEKGSCQHIVSASLKDQSCSSNSQTWRETLSENPKPGQKRKRSCEPEADNPFPKKRNSLLLEKAKEEEPEDPGDLEDQGKNSHISYWAANQTWPSNFGAMSSNKRQRASEAESSKEEKSPSYAQSRREGEVPQQYTKAYEIYISTMGLEMDDFKGENLVSADSKATCEDLQYIRHKSISTSVYSKAEITKLVKLSRNRNEAMVNRDITPLIVPPISQLYLKDQDKQYEHITDEVNTQWNESWVLAGPRPKPDLAVGFLSSAFTTAEIEKLTNYTSYENLTKPTDYLCFPFLMCEVKCGNEGLDYPDRQNMHSCSVAVKALLKLEQKADEYRGDKQFANLLGKILVYSISHDQKNARVYGHFALVEGEKWTYYRHHIANFDIYYKETDLLALHNFARNVLTQHAPEVLKRVQRAIDVLPASTMLSFSAGTMSLMDESQAGSRPVRDSQGFVMPVVPASAQSLFDEQTRQIEEQRRQVEEHKKEVEEQRRQVEEQRRQAEEQRRQAEEQKQQMDRLLQQLEQQGRDSKEREERMQLQMERQMEELKSEKQQLLDLLKQRLG